VAALLRVLAIVVLLAASLLSVASCGQPALQSARLLEIASASVEMRNKAVVAFLRPTASERDIAEMRRDLPICDWVESWAECGSAQAVDMYRAIWQKQYGAEAAQETADRMIADFSGRPLSGAFVASASDNGLGIGGDSLSSWFLDHPCVVVVHSWADGTLCCAGESR